MNYFSLWVFGVQKEKSTGEFLSPMRGTYKCDICCQNHSFLKHEGFCGVFLFFTMSHLVFQVQTSTERARPSQNGRKGGTAVQISLPVANKNVHLYTI